ncbi:MAG: acyl--CoA ligase [Desulfohalobiaceae bacterium]|nr:acyl--CoA ligase [Desulfohalobiaceae bacterium]
MNFARYCHINAKKFPDREFLIASWPSRDKREALAWKELNDKANKVANFLKDHCKVQPGDIVLHLMMNSFEWFIMYMAVLKTGAAVSPLNFRFAGKDIKYAADVTKGKTFILGEGFVPKVQPVQSELPFEQYICVGDDCPEGMTSLKSIIENGNPANLCLDTEEDQMAELMFTSGTTGFPKPVAHTHQSLFFIGTGNALTYNEGHDSVYLAPHPFYHSGSLFLSFPSYIAAGKVLMPMEINPKSYIQSIASEKCTGGWNTVPTWSDLISAIKSGEINVQDYDLSHLRHIEIGAQPVPQVLFEDSKRIFPHVKMGNIYGITEGGGGGILNLYDENVLRKPGSIGKATAFTELKIIDLEGNELPPGEVGELLVRGPRTMKEYAWNPEKTAAILEQDGWLHTEDLARMDEEGFVFFCDRQKDLIIRGGENIFPAEIEDCLRRHPKIEDVAIIGYPDDRLGEIIMTVIKPRPGEELTQEGIIEFCKQEGLAKYKWPEKVTFGDVPRNPSGKLQKNILRDQYQERK